MSALPVSRQRIAILSPGQAPLIETERLILRPHRLSDADAITESLSDFAVTRMMSRVPTPYVRSDAIDWLVANTSGLAETWNPAITEKDDVHIGVVSLELRHDRWYLAYWLNRYYWRKGIMTEAVIAALERFSRRMPQTAVHSGIFADNPASLKLQQRLGFKIVGCAEAFSFARSTMVPQLQTVLEPDALGNLTAA